MKNYGSYLRIVMLVIVLMVFAGIAFGNAAGKTFFLLLFLFGVFNDFIRKHFLKKHPLYLLSFLLSAAIAGVLKYFFSELMDGYLYLLMIEILFREKTKTPVYLLAPHILAFFGGYFFRFRNMELLNSLGGGLLSYLLGLCIVLSVREAIIQRDQVNALNTQLSSKNQQLLQYQSQLKELALNAERNRVAQELHDSLGHTLMAIRMNIKVLEKIGHSDPDKEDRIIRSLDEIVQNGISQLRETVFQLKNEAEKKPLKSSLREMIDQLSANGGAEIDLEYDDRVDECLPEIKDALYKAGKEGITNAVRHGKASKISVSISAKDNAVQMRISDNGCGCDEIKKSYGLQGIEERFAAWDGHISYKSKRGQGFVITAEVPIYKHESEKVKENTGKGSGLL